MACRATQLALGLCRPNVVGDMASIIYMTEAMIRCRVSASVGNQLEFNLRLKDMSVETDISMQLFN